MQLRDDFVAVSVPATSANLGPGFDSLGLALGLHDDVSVHATTGHTSVVVEGEGAGHVPEDEDNLVVRALRLGLDRVGAPQVGIRMHCTNRIPHGRGLGSSASAVIAGLALARALVGDPDVLGADDLLEIGTDVEGHPDNVAPAVLGGATVAWSEQGRSGALRMDPPAIFSPVAFVPDFELATSAARAALPPQVGHHDAAYNASRAALLAALLAGGGGVGSRAVGSGSGGTVGGAEEGATQLPDVHALLMEATRDRLHQEYRRSSMPQSLALVDWLREAGLAAVVSGAGPTVLSLESVPEIVLAQARQAGWAVHRLNVDPHGVRQTRGRLAESGV
ncbi:MAG: homoserine kinase [Pauljensenia sp.]